MYLWQCPFLFNKCIAIIHAIPPPEIVIAAIPAWIFNRADEAWTGSIQLLYPSKSSAILYHSRVEMPSIGLPRILEQTMSNILDISQLSSFKIAGNGPRTTIVLRFDECMADANVSPIHRSTPQSYYRRKPPIQMKRDRDRMEQHRNLLGREKSARKQQFKTIQQQR